MKRLMLILLVALPAASVVMGAVTVYLAVTNPDPAAMLDALPLSKTNTRAGR